jgi:signal transduction histidine kinase
MPTPDDSPDGFVYDALDQLRHDLKTPLTTIHGRAYLLGRMVQRSPSLSDAERVKMLEGIAVIETEVRSMSAAIDAIRDKGAGGEQH